MCLVRTFCCRRRWNFVIEAVASTFKKHWHKARTFFTRLAKCKISIAKQRMSLIYKAAKNADFSEYN